MRFYLRLAQFLPTGVVYQCLILAIVHGTTGKYSKEDVTRVSAVVIADRWLNDKVKGVGTK